MFIAIPKRVFIYFLHTIKCRASGMAISPQLKSFLFFFSTRKKTWKVKLCLKKITENLFDLRICVFLLRNIGIFKWTAKTGRAESAVPYLKRDRLIQKNRRRVGGVGEKVGLAFTNMWWRVYSSTKILLDLTELLISRVFLVLKLSITLLFVWSSSIKSITLKYSNSSDRDIGSYFFLVQTYC